MLNEQANVVVDAARVSDGFAAPLYDSYCFSQIPATVFHALTGAGKPGLPESVWADLPRRYDKVIVLLIDAFGWRFMTQHADHPFMQRFFGERGIASKITTQFPSTTSAHIPTIHTGLNVGQTGLYEWFMYEPLVDDVIVPLMFSYASDQERDTLGRAGISAAQIFPFTTLYQQLATYGVSGIGVQNYQITPSPATNAFAVGATMHRCFTLTDGIVTLRDAVLNTRGKGYFYYYYEGVDTVSHHRGPSSAEVQAEIETVLFALENHLMRALDGQAKNTLVILTADHGQIEVNDRNIPQLNQIAPGILPLLKRNRAGKMLVPAGSGRDIFLHVAPENLAEVEGLLDRSLPLGFSVNRTADLMTGGVFAEATPRLRERIGDLLILSEGNQLMSWSSPRHQPRRFRGHHGAMTRAEMETGCLLTVV